MAGLSWLFNVPTLAFIALILAGILLGQYFKLEHVSRQRLELFIAQRIHLQANDGEVVIGLLAFFITLVPVFLVAEQTDRFFDQKTGLNSPQIVSVLVVSYFGTVIWSIAVFLVIRLGKFISSRINNRDQRDHNKVIQGFISRERTDS